MEHRYWIVSIKDQAVLAMTCMPGCPGYLHFPYNNLRNGHCTPIEMDIGWMYGMDGALILDCKYKRSSCTCDDLHVWLLGLLTLTPAR